MLLHMETHCVEVGEGTHFFSQWVDGLDESM